MLVSSKLKPLLATLLVLLVANPLAAAATTGAYHGFVSNDNINKGDRIRFSGTFFNFKSSTEYVHFFNVSFVEILGDTATKNPAKPNITRTYTDQRRVVIANGSFTDTITQKINFDPGLYNVSIFFMHTNSTTSTVNTGLDISYALVNQSFTVQGVTEGLEILRVIGISIGVISAVVIGLLVYNSKFRKSY